MLGTKAPDFNLSATTGHQVSLDDLRGSYIVLIFYPANDTPVCNLQLDQMSLRASQFLQHNARVFGVNTAKVDKSRDYCTRKRLEFPILSDSGGETAKKYKAFWGWLGMNRRTVVVINPLGTICFYAQGKPSPETVIQAITADQQAPQSSP
jgi:peroxiredoxin Q/BCP